MRYEPQLREAVAYFWQERAKQKHRQQSGQGVLDQGNRASVTGGKQLDGFASIFKHLLVECGTPETFVHTRKETTYLPGYYRPTKQWDIVIAYKENLVAAIELKSQVGSFGNNYNNRIEEALGSATDLATAFREGTFAPSCRPWSGYLMLAEESPKSTKPVKTKAPHFPIRQEFTGSSYMERYEIFCKKLVRERLYDSACLIASSQVKGLAGEYREPSEEIDFARFAGALLGHVAGFLHVNR